MAFTRADTGSRLSLLMTTLLGISKYAIIIFFSLIEVRGLISPLKQWPSRQSEVSVVPSLVNSTYKELFSHIIDNKRNFRYTVEISLNGTRVPVALDTGSTDMWIDVPSFREFTNTRISTQIHYGDGTYGVEGTIGIARFQFGSINIRQQAFLHVTKNTISGLRDLGVFGLLGLGFDSGSSSLIHAAIRTKYGTSTTLGYSVLHHHFDRNPSEPKIVALHLTRWDDPDAKNGGSVAIGEYDSRYSAVSKAPKLLQYPDDGDRWTTLLGGIHVNGRSIRVKSRIKGVPAGHAIAYLDAGAPYGTFPIAIWNAIYSRIPGAVKYRNSLWIVPCKTTSIVELTFGGKKYPIHPLELTFVGTVKLSSRLTVTYCGSAFRGQDLRRSDLEISLGDSFLRNVYTAYNFGDTSSNGNPYMQLLSIVNTRKAISQVTSIRGKQLARLPRELAPAELIKRLPH